ncbi:hypothetical protein GCU56_15450 [Geodermatophilus sabuli]|uniref:Uncharacterized protein n=1 Tax=Geodermatophilus sabuli TaxID=1564158 RepID=A0A7K3W2Z4_9ACTN|nr:acyl-homoserine-lactone synthase [Geodermatophilus sabuli]NEK59261.1 hypothetical protein [Geodermatophilus sabuli]
MPLRLLIAHSPTERAAAREVEARVFLQAFGNTPEVMEEEYGPYGDRSRFVVVIDDASGSALGAARLILPDGTGMVKTLADVAGEPWRLSVPDSLRAADLAGRPVWDVASLAVDRRYRSGAAGAEVTLALCHGLFQYSRLCGADGLVTILDDRVLRLLRAMGVPWAAMAGATSREYLGSPASTPCICLVDAIGESIRATRPDLAPAVVEGVFRSIALDPADLFPGRGGSLPEAAVSRQPARTAAPRRDTSGWRPPTHRRPEVAVSSPGTAAGS